MYLPIAINHFYLFYLIYQPSLVIAVNQCLAHLLIVLMADSDFSASELRKRCIPYHIISYHITSLHFTSLRFFISLHITNENSTLTNHIFMLCIDVDLRGGSIPDDQLSSAQVRARHAVPKNRDGNMKFCYFHNLSCLSSQL